MPTPTLSNNTETTLDKKIQPFISEEAHELLRVETARRNTSFGEVLNSLVLLHLAANRQEARK